MGSKTRFFHLFFRGQKSTFFRGSPIREIKREKGVKKVATFWGSKRQKSDKNVSHDFGVRGWVLSSSLFGWQKKVFFSCFLTCFDPLFWPPVLTPDFSFKSLSFDPSKFGGILGVFLRGTFWGTFWGTFCHFLSLFCHFFHFFDQKWHVLTP